MATSSPSKRKEVTALNGDYWKPLEEKKRRRTAPPVFTVEDPFYSKIEKNLLKTVLDESKEESSPKKKSKDKTPKDVDSPKKTVENDKKTKKKRNSKTETKKSPKQNKEKEKRDKKEEDKSEVVVIPDSPTPRVRKSGNRSYIRRSASSSPSTKTAKSIETSSNIAEPVDASPSESEVSYKKEDTDSEVDIISLDEEEPPKQQQQIDTKPIEIIDDDEKDTKSKEQEPSSSRPQRKRKKKEEPEQETVKKLKKTKETKLKRTSSSKTRTLKGKHEKSLRLDEALSRTDMEGWSSARINAYKAIETNPNMYYYRFNAPGEKQRNGGWTDEEKEMFHKRIKELGGIGDYQWGIFSMAIPGRVGYQCANFYRKLIKDGEIKDENYSLNDKGEPIYIGGKSKKKSKSKEEEQEVSESPKKKKKKENKENVTDNKKKKTSKKESDSPKKEGSKSESPKKESPKKNESPKKLKQMKLDSLLKTDTTPEKPKRGRPRKGSEKKKKGKLTEEEKSAKKQQEILKKQQEKDIKAQRKLDLEKELEERLKGKEIIPRIFLGNKDVARNQEWLQENGVKHVVNVTREVGNYYEEELKYKRIMIDDSMDQDIAKHFEDSCAFISNALKESSDGSILVHCNEGRSRSVTLIIAYLMKYENMNLSSAFNHIHSKSMTKINDGFKRQLMSYELSLGKEKSIEFFPSRRGSKENVLNTSGSRVSTPVNVKEVSVVEKEEVSEMQSLFSKVISTTTTTTTTTTQETTNLPASDNVSFMALDEIPGTSPPAPNQLIKLDPSLEKTMVIPPVATALDRTDSISDMEEEPLSDPMYWGAEIYSDHETTNAVPPTPQNPKTEELLSVGLDDEWLNGILTQ